MRLGSIFCGPSRTAAASVFIMSGLMVLYVHNNNLFWGGISPPAKSQPGSYDDLQGQRAEGAAALCAGGNEPSWGSDPSWQTFYNFITDTTDRCHHLGLFGGRNKSTINGRDGEKAVCLDRGPAPTPGRCLVLSFGINNEWSFDDQMERYGCEVHAFDPTMDQPAHTRGDNIHFLPLGLGGRRETVTASGKTFEVLSYREILDTIQKTDSIIDYLKIDIEGFERSFLRNVLCDDTKLLDNVKQIGMEIHIGKNSHLRNEFWNYIHVLQQLQFSPVYSEPNLALKNPFKYKNKMVSKCYEIVWINNNFR